MSSNPAPREFLHWWNQNWPDLCPTQIALAAWDAGRAIERKTIIKEAKAVAQKVGGKWWKTHQLNLGLNKFIDSVSA